MQIDVYVGGTWRASVEFVDRQTRAYTGGLKRHFYGDVYPEAQRAQETRVTFRMAASKVNTDATFA